MLDSGENSINNAPHMKMFKLLLLKLVIKLIRYHKQSLTIANVGRMQISVAEP